MSKQVRYLSSSVRSTKIAGGSNLTPSRTARVSKRCLSSSTLGFERVNTLKTTMQSSVRTWSRASHALAREEVRQDYDARARVEEMERDGSTLAERVLEEDGVDVSATNATHHLTEHLNGLFSPLQFPDELAKRILTHGSHPAAVDGHNAGFAFLGRRVLESYLLLFLNASPALNPSHDLEQIASRTLNTYLLGQHVGSQWGLGRVMRWTPTLPAERLNMNNPADKTTMLKNVGLYKVQGFAVSAVVGGIFHQFGGTEAHKVFHTRVLPNLLLRGRAEGLPDVFHQDALATAERMSASSSSSSSSATYRTVGTVGLNSAPASRQRLAL